MWFNLLPSVNPTADRLQHNLGHVFDVDLCISVTFLNDAFVTTNHCCFNVIAFY